MSIHTPVSAETNAVARGVLDAAFAVHSKLGPGLLESVYQRCLIYELRKRGYRAREQVSLPVLYDELVLGDALKLDLVVDDMVIVELKAIEGILPVHEAQVITYLKLSGLRLGLLINFNVPLLKQGIRRLVL